MPQLPQIIADRVPQGGEQSITAAQLPGEALAGFGRQVGEIGSQMAEKQIQLQRLNDFTAHSTDASMAIDAAVGTELANPDFRTAPERINTAIQKITGETLKNVKDDQVRAELQSQLDKQRASEIINARDFARKKEIDYGKSMFDASLDRNRTKLATLTGPEHDAQLSQVQGLSDAAVASGLYSKEQMWQKMDQFYKGVTEDKARIDGVIDPVGTAKELVGGTAYNSLNPTDRLQLAKQIISEQDTRERQKEHQLGILQEGDITQATQATLEGKFTHQQLDDLTTKWAATGVPLTSDKYQHLFELINKPAEQPASNARVLDAATHAVRTTIPAISKAQLWDLHQAGGLNLDDYTKLDGELTSSLRYQKDQAKNEMNARTSLAEQIIVKNFGDDPAILADALKKLSDTTKFGGNVDPMSIIPGLEKQFGPAMERLGGQSVKGANSAFIAARNSYQAANQGQRNWNSIHNYKRYFVENPYDALIVDRKDNLKTAAEKAGKYLGETKQNDGDHFLGPHGEKGTAIGGMGIID